MDKIEEITICLHCGCYQNVVDKQMELLEGLNDIYKVHWNNRIDRFPQAYPSYSQLVNHTIATSNTEFMVLINDRAFPTVEETVKMIGHLENGYACSMIYNVANMGFSKELVRTIGWWDERFLNGGWEDRDWVYRLKLADLALYESLEGEYDQTWKSPLQIEDGCAAANPVWHAKYDQGHKKNDWDNGDGFSIIKRLEEPEYPEWEKTLGSPRHDISKTWKPWSESKLGLYYEESDEPRGGPSASSMINNRDIIEHYG
jgi:hypothetical protein